MRNRLAHLRGGTSVTRPAAPRWLQDHIIIILRNFCSGSFVFGEPGQDGEVASYGAESDP